MADRKDPIALLETAYDNMLESRNSGGDQKERLIIDAEEKVLKAIDLLQTQEPRVMTLEEALHAPFAWTETRDGYMSIRRIRGIRNEPTNMTVEGFSITMAIIPKAKYGRFVRCWTSRPTDAQRESTPWANT